MTTVTEQIQNINPPKQKATEESTLFILLVIDSLTLSALTLFVPFTVLRNAAFKWFILAPRL